MPLTHSGVRARLIRRLSLFVVVGMAALSPAFAAAPAGEVVYAHGLTSVQREGEAARFVTKGDPISEGDTITTGPKGFAVIGLKDGTKMTLRPETSFAVEKFSHGEQEEAGFFRLIKGGVRA